MKSLAKANLPPLPAAALGSLLKNSIRAAPGEVCCRFVVTAWNNYETVIYTITKMSRMFNIMSC
jgi:hypothetical protein